MSQTRGETGHSAGVVDLRR